MWQWLIEIDKSFFYFINSSLSNPFFDLILPPIRNSKNWIFLYLIIVFLAFKSKGLKYTTYIMLLAGFTIFLCDFIIANNLKHYFERLRPCNDESMNVHLLIERCGSGFSFVSAHACNHFAIAFIINNILHLRFKHTYFLVYIWAAIISFAQVYVGVHFPFDVICGGILGATVGWFTTSILSPIFIRKLNI